MLPPPPLLPASPPPFLSNQLHHPMKVASSPHAMAAVVVTTVVAALPLFIIRLVDIFCLDFGPIFIHCTNLYSVLSAPPHRQRLLRERHFVHCRRAARRIHRVVRSLFAEVSGDDRFVASDIGGVLQQSSRFVRGGRGGWIVEQHDDEQLFGLPG